ASLRTRRSTRPARNGWFLSHWRAGEGSTAFRRSLGFIVNLRENANLRPRQAPDAHTPSAKTLAEARLWGSWLILPKATPLVNRRNVIPNLPGLRRSNFGLPWSILIRRGR